MLLGNDPKPLIIPQAAYGLINNNEVQPQTPLLAKTSYFSPQTESDVNSAQIISNLSTDNHQSDPISTNSPTSNPSSPQHPPQKLYQPPTDLPPISKYHYYYNNNTNNHYPIFYEHYQLQYYYAYDNMSYNYKNNRHDVMYYMSIRWEPTGIHNPRYTIPYD